MQLTEKVGTSCTKPTSEKLVWSPATIKGSGLHSLVWRAPAIGLAWLLSFYVNNCFVHRYVQCYMLILFICDRLKKQQISFLFTEHTVKHSVMQGVLLLTQHFFYPKGHMTCCCGGFML